jgi:hypothetical protein
MLDQHFCEFLEYELTKAFSISVDVSLRNFWCDGILLPHAEKDLSKKNVNAKKYLSMTAFSGETGQDKYELILNFGPKSLSRYARGLDIRECIPHPDDTHWVEVDRKNKTITVKLL